MATMPSLYQLLPHPHRAWTVDVEGNRLERDLYDPAVRASLRLVDLRRGRSGTRRRGRARFEEWSFAELEARFARSLRRAKAFHLALSAPVERSPIRYLVFGGNCIVTPALCLLEIVNGEPKVRLHPEDAVSRVP